MGINVEQEATTIKATGSQYVWQWSATDDHLQIFDTHGRTIARGKVQPAILVKSAQSALNCRSGRVADYNLDNRRLTVRYEGVNGDARVTLVWRFEENAVWLEPIIYETNVTEDIVSVHYFSEGIGDAAQPALYSSEHVIPGINMSGTISPFIAASSHLHGTANLGAAAQYGPVWGLQWALPVHFFVGFNRQTQMGATNGLVNDLSDAFCCGLATLPVGDLWLDFNRGYTAPHINVRSDLWGHRRGPGAFELGGEWVFAFGRTYRDAIAAYYRVLRAAGIVRPIMEHASTAKREAALTPQFNTWGAQVARGLKSWQLDETILNAIYDELQTNGMQARMFVIDDKWEGRYGRLEHDSERFPNFEAFLARVRADGYRLGLWAALLRCQNPEEIGLTTEHMLHKKDDTPLVVGEEASHYFIFDVTRPEVAEVLRGLAKRFTQRYRPDLVKFDFGYELPVLDMAAPHDMEWSGERLLQKGLEIIIGAMKEENPDLVVMYYGLSPLLAEFYDLHSPDDLFLAIGDYDLEANRRFYFSSICSEFEMPTYGSSGYDWVTSPSIWFDSAAIGTVGSLNSFTGDEIGGMPSPQLIAKYNGVTHALRSTTVFHIEALDETRLNSSRGATAASWARIENGEPTLVALRQHRWDGVPAAGRYQDLVVTDTQVIVASRSDNGLATATDLAIVPYGTGMVSLQHSGSATKASITEHVWGGNTHTSEVSLNDSELLVSLREVDDDGVPVEWLQVSLH